MIRKLAALLLVALSAAAVGQSKTGKETVFKEALEQARRNSKTTEGGKYDAALATLFGQRHVNSMDRCTSIAAPDLRSFEIVMQIAADGSATHIMVSPETNVSTCVKKDLMGEVFVRPPHSDYWAHIPVELRAE
jgi:hypothetical protein